MSRPKRSHAAACLVLGLALSGCSGPTSHVSIIGKAEPLDVAFGLPSLTTVPANAPLVPVPGGLGLLPVTSLASSRTVKVVYVNDPGGTGAVAPPPPACPTAAPLAVPRDVAPNVIVTAAPQGTFTYRVSGLAVEGGKARTFTGTSAHTVTSRTLAGGTYTFTVTQLLAGATTSFDYTVVPPAETAADVHGGIELSSVKGNGGLGYQASFHPDKPLKVFDQPSYSGGTWQDAETDPVSQTVAVVSGTVQGKDRVDACGTLLDSYETTTTLDLTSPNESMTITLRDWWATQYGGLPIAEEQQYKGHLPDGTAVSGSLTQVISVLPKGAT